MSSGEGRVRGWFVGSIWVVLGRQERLPQVLCFRVRDYTHILDSRKQRIHFFLKEFFFTFMFIYVSLCVCLSCVCKGPWKIEDVLGLLYLKIGPFKTSNVGLGTVFHFLEDDKHLQLLNQLSHPLLIFSWFDQIFLNSLKWSLLHLAFMYDWRLLN